MVGNIFYNSKTAKIENRYHQRNLWVISVLRYQFTGFIVFNIPIHYYHKY